MKAFQKGQMGFDFMFALVAMLLVIQFLIIFSDELTLDQNKINIRNQEQTIALKIKSVYNACLIADLGPDSDTSITTELPPIRDLTGYSDDCNIEFNQATNTLSISHTNEKGDIVEFELHLPEAKGFIPDAACGEEITVSC